MLKLYFTPQHKGMSLEQTVAITKLYLKAYRLNILYKNLKYTLDNVAFKIHCYKLWKSSLNSGWLRFKLCANAFSWYFFKVTPNPGGKVPEADDLVLSYVNEVPAITGNMFKILMLPFKLHAPKRTKKSTQ